MQIDTLHRLRELDNGFYRSNSRSFSKTRQRPWQGWERIAACLPCSGPFSVLDVACGNMRFEKYLRAVRPQVRFTFDCIDVCDDLADGEFQESYRHLDVLEALERGESLALDGKRYDFAACFGFMHHVPSGALREELLQNLVGCVRKSGIAAVSFWEFANDPKKRRQAVDTTARVSRDLDIQLEGNDYFLGWNDKDGAYRYCHSFTPSELDLLARSVQSDCELIERFSADGKNSSMNEYMVFRRR